MKAWFCRWRKKLALRRPHLALAGALFRASSEYSGHEAGKLASFNPATAGQPKVFSSQVSPHDLAEAKRRMQDEGGRKLDLAVVVYYIATNSTKASCPF